MFLNKYYESQDLARISIIEKQAIAAREDGSIRTVDFWENAILTNWINRKDLLQKLSLIFPVLDRTFPDNWDVNWELVECGLMPSLIIYFPEVVVSNHRESKSHLIKGLGVVLKFRNWYYEDGDNFDSEDLEYKAATFTSEVYGFRTHKTFVEWLRGYQHSHLSVIYTSDNPMKADSFCLGDSEIYSVFQQLDECNAFSNPEQYATIFEMLCMMLISHAETESPEGGPYIYYSHLTGISRSRWNGNTDLTFSNFIDFIKSNQIPLKFNYVFDGRQYIIKNNNHFRNRVKELLLCWGDTTMLVSIGEDGYEYSYSQDGQEVESMESIVRGMNHRGKTPFILIQGRKIELQIDKPEEQENQIENYQVAKQFLYHVKKQVEKELNARLIKNTAIRAYNQALLERIYNGENPVSVQ